jgi:CPA2 family monovalent cation:H+ antiporter-2
MGSGLLLSSFGYSPILGYIIAGVLLGPSCLQFIVDRDEVAVFSEMGILFLLFAIGLGLSFEKVKNIWRTSITSTIISTILIYVVMLIAGAFLGISSSGIILMTFCVALSSTAVTVKSLKYQKEQDPNIEENTYGILIAQDLIALLMVIIINFMGSSKFVGYDAVKVSAVCVISSILVLSFLKFRHHAHKLANFIKKHEEMLAMSIFGICLGCAVLAEVVGLSAPFGGFIAGLLLGNSNIKDEIKRVSAPIEEITLMTFFLSVGLLVDIKFIQENYLTIFSALLFVTIGKTFINIFVMRLCRFSMKESFVIGVLLANIGEFSFMLVSAASKNELVNPQGVKFLVSLTTLSLFLSPFWLIFAERCRILAGNASVSSSWDFFQLALAREIKNMHRFSNCIVRICGRISSPLRRKQLEKSHLDDISSTTPPKQLENFYLEDISSAAPKKQSGDSHLHDISSELSQNQQENDSAGDNIISESLQNQQENDSAGDNIISESPQNQQENDSADDNIISELSQNQQEKNESSDA